MKAESTSVMRKRVAEVFMSACDCGEDNPEDSGLGTQIRAKRSWLSTTFFLEICLSDSKKFSGELPISFQSFYGKYNAGFQFLIRKKIVAFSTLHALPSNRATAALCVSERRTLRFHSLLSELSSSKFFTRSFSCFNSSRRCGRRPMCALRRLYSSSG